MSNLTEQQQKYVKKFFENYPDESMYDDLDKCSEALKEMADAVRSLRKEAIANESVALLEKARVLDGELTNVFGLLQQRHMTRALKSGIQLPTPDIHGHAWKK